jgi:uncharacterized protein YacL
MMAFLLALVLTPILIIAFLLIWLIIHEFIFKKFLGSKGAKILSTILAITIVVYLIITGINDNTKKTNDLHEALQQYKKATNQENISDMEDYKQMWEQAKLKNELKNYKK